MLEMMSNPLTNVRKQVTLDQTLFQMLQQITDKSIFSSICSLKFIFKTILVFHSSSQYMPS